MTVCGFFISHPAYITVKEGADVIKFVENYAKFFPRIPIKKSRHVEVYDVKLWNPVAHNFRHAVKPVPVTNNRMAAQESQRHHPPANASAAIPP